MLQILRFEMNVPTQLAIADPEEGKRVAGRYGDQVMYRLTEDQIVYVPPIVAGRIKELGIQPGEVFQVCKKFSRDGCRRLVEWQVSRLEATPKSSESDTRLAEQLEKSIEAIHAAKVVRVPAHGVPPITPSSPAAIDVPVRDITQSDELPQERVPDAPALPAAVGAVVPPPTPPAPPSPPNGCAHPAKQNGNIPPTPTTKLEHALKTAISAAYNAEKYGAELGYVVRFDADAIKSMAITVLINMSERSQR
ncbi:MAG: hypothetical protein ABL995_19040 [Bryobacteraceae bacterium]